MSKIRHILLAQTVIFTKTPGAGNPPEAKFYVGCVNIPKNKVYSLKNFSITQSDSLVTGSGSSFNSFVVFHRFFGTDDPIRDFVNSLPSGYTLLFNGSSYAGGFSFQDQNDSQGTAYNEVTIRNTNSGQTLLNCLDVKTNTKHETIPITINPFYKDLKDFYFDSGTNNFLAFCIFPYLDFNVPTNPLTFAVDYSINFDLIQE